MMTWATPDIWLICCASWASTLSLTVVSGSVSEVADSSRIGESAGLTFDRSAAWEGSSANCPLAALIAACTSLAAPSIERLRSNWMVNRGRAEIARRGHLRDAGNLRELPLQRLARTEEAMVSGLAPGRLAVIWMVGKSTCGAALPAAADRRRGPTNRIPAISNEVARDSG